jgi:hypothetical protein
MAQKKLRAAILVARKTFLIDGNRWVRQGDTAVAGHPIMKGHEAAFEPWHPTFGTIEDPEEKDAGKPDALAARNALVARAKELGIPAGGKSDELAASIAAAEAEAAAKAAADAEAAKAAEQAPATPEPEADA